MMGLDHRVVKVTLGLSVGLMKLDAWLVNFLTRSQRGANRGSREQLVQAFQFPNPVFWEGSSSYRDFSEGALCWYLGVG